MQFFCHDYLEDLLALITFTKKFGFLAGIVFKIFAIENALQSKINFWRDAFGKSYLLRHLIITIARKNLVLEIGCTYYENFSVFAEKYILQLFSKGKQHQNLMRLFFFFFGQVEIFSGK